MIIKTTTTKERFSRRALLKRIGASAAMLPLINAERALAAPNGAPKRLVTIAWGHGVAQPSFYPPGENPVEMEIMKPLAPYASKVLLPAGIDIKVMLDANHRYDGHFSYPSLFTGTYVNMGGQRSAAGGPSIDQIYSDEVAKVVNLPKPLMVMTAAGSSASFRGDSARNTGETDPGRLFMQLFAGASLPPGQFDGLRARRKSVLDHLNRELQAFRGRVGTEDGQKISSHLESVRQLELQLNAATSAACQAPGMVPGTDFPAKMKAFIDITAMAIRCDLTRAVSMAWAADVGGAPGSFPFLGVAGDYHGIAHQGPGGYASKIKIDTWYMTQLASLAKQLDETLEESGTALDNSVIVLANNMNEGAGHDVTKIPVVIVGSGGGYLKTGRAVRLGNWVGKSGTYWRMGDSGVPHNKLLATILNALDVPTTGIGPAAYAGTLPELVA